MSKLKTSFDLSQERVIISSYKPNTLLDDMVEFGVDKEEDLPDFIVDWKKPYETIEKEIDFVDKVKAPKEKLPPGIRAQKAQTFYYEENIKTKEIFWHGQFTSYNGLSRTGRAIVFGLCNKNIKTKIAISPSIQHINEATMKELQILKNHEVSNNCLNIYHNFVPKKFISKNNILYMMFNKSYTAEMLKGFNEIWVTSNVDKKGLPDISIPIFVIPLGVDSSRYNPETNKFSIKTPLNNFIFLSVLEWKKEKAYNLLLNSFMEEFSSKDDVSLLISTKTEESNIMEDFMKIREKVDKTNEELPHIVVYDKTIPEKDMPELYSLSNSFVLLSEYGCGLSYLESAATGKPIIAGNWGNKIEYMNKDNAFLVDSDDLLQQTRKYMRFILENYEESIKKADKLKDIVKQNYSWEKTNNLVYDRIIANIGDK